MDNHNISFFGQKTGIIVSSPSMSDECFFIKFIKNKGGDAGWEKPSQGEGQTIKFNMGELVSIIHVFENFTAWKTVHRFNDAQTSINIVPVKNGDGISISIKSGNSSYSKLMKFPDTIVLRDLLKHMYEEKIIHATGANSSGRNNSFKGNGAVSNLSKPSSTPMSRPVQQNQGYQQNETVTIRENRRFNQPEDWLGELQGDEEGEYVLIPGKITRSSEKAILIEIDGLAGGSWFPTSQIKDADLSDSIGGVWVKKWIITKNFQNPESSLSKLFTDSIAATA